MTIHIVLIAIMAGAGSGKSVYISMKLIIKALRNKRRVLVCRRYGSTIKDTVFAQFISSLNSLKILEYCKVSEYNRTIILPNGSEIIFKSLDEETKLLSLTDISDIFVEEVWEVPKPIFEQLNTRLRANVPSLQLYFAFNPISQNHWLYEWVNNPPSNSYILKTTYRDNKFLNPSVVEAYEEQGKRNAAWKRVYIDGEFGVNPDGLVYRNVKVGAFDQEEVIKRRDIDIRVGIDTGFIDATAIGIMAFDHKTKECFVLKECYKIGLTLDQIYNELENMGIANTRSPVYCDSADQRSIAFLKSKNVRVRPAIKGPGSIEAGISFLQNYTIYVPHTCPNAINELQSYSYYKNPKTGLYEDGKYDGPDHFCDCMRYSVCDLYTNNKISIINKRNLGL